MLADISGGRSQTRLAEDVHLVARIAREVEVEVAVDDFLHYLSVFLERVPVARIVKVDGKFGVEPPLINLCLNTPDRLIDKITGASLDGRVANLGRL